MRMRIILLFIIGAAAFTIAACSKNTEQDIEKLPGIDIPLREMNSEIMLEPNPGMPQVHKNGETLVFLIRNRSSSTISFDQDFGVKIFQKEGMTWKTVENKWGYPEGKNILPPTTESPTGLALFVFPAIEDIKKSTNVRIVVVGHIKDKSEEQVGAYIDVQYEP